MPRTMIIILVVILLQLSILSVVAASDAVSAQNTGKPVARSLAQENKDNISKLIETGKVEEASQLLKDCLDRATTPEERKQFEAVLVILANTFYSAAEKASSNLKFSEAIDKFKQSLEINRLVDNSSRNREVLFSLISIANNEEKLHDHSAALKSYTYLIDLIEENNTLLAALLYSRGNLLYKMSRPAEALKDITKAASIYAEHKEEGDNYEDCIKLSAFIFIDLYKYAEGEQELNKLLAIQQNKKNKAPDGREVNTIVQLAKLKQKQFRFSEAEQLFKKAFKLQEQLFPDAPENSTYITQALGNFYQFIGRFSEAEAEFKKNVALYENKPNERIEYAKMLTNMGDYYLNSRRYNDALTFHRSSLEIRDSLFGRSSLESIYTRQSIATIYRFAGRYKEAEDLLHELLGDSAKLQGIQSALYGDLLDDMAQLYNVWEKSQKSEIKARGALQNASNLHGEVSYNTVGYRETLIYVLSNIGQLEKAEELAHNNLVITEKQFGKQSPKYAANLRVLGMTFRTAARYGEALKTYNEALAISENVYGALSPNSMINRYWLARVFAVLGESKKAEEQYKLVVTSYENTYGKDSDNLSSTLDNLAFLYMNDGRFDAASKTIKRFHEIRTSTYGSENPENSLNTLAVFKRRTGNYAAAEKIYLNDLEQGEKNFGGASKSVAGTNHNLAWLYYSMKDYGKAEQYARKSLASYTAIYGKDNRMFSDTLTVLGLALNKNNKTDEAEQLFQRSIKLNNDAELEDGFSQMGLGELYLSQKRYAEALPALLEGLRISVRENDFELKWVCLNDISMLMEQQANAEAALFLAKQTITTIQKSMEDIALIGTEELKSYQKLVTPLYTRLSSLLAKNGDNVRSQQVMSQLKFTKASISNVSGTALSLLLTTRELNLESMLEKQIQALTGIIQERKAVAGRPDKNAENNNRLVLLDKEKLEATAAFNQFFSNNAGNVNESSNRTVK